ncbi:CHASE2 domain-containing protein [Devosia sp.]|uniref:CHASE2 domain-containing protein n=1 Tax=Devosia sp. TaxID=1871048 RepID=UPI002EFBB8FC
MLNRRLVPTLFGFGLVLGLVLLRAADPYPVQALRDIAFDFYQRQQPRAAADFPIRIVDIDEASLRDVGQWPWPRDRLAVLIDRLAEMGAAAIAVDVLLPEPDRLSPRRLAQGFPGLADAAALPDTDQMLAAALGRAPVALGFADSPYSRSLPAAAKSGFAVSGGNPIQAVPQLQGAVVPLPVLGAAASGLGSLSLAAADSVATVRRVPLLWTDGKQYFPTLSLEALRLALGVSTIVVMAETGGGGGVEAVRVGSITIPTTPAGELWLYYRRPDAGQYVAARDLLGPGYQQHAAAIAGHVVFIGASASGLLDIHTTTLGDNVPGVSIHAQALEQMLSGRFLTRTDWVAGLEIVFFLVLGAGLVVAVLGLGPLAGLLLGAAALAGTGLYSWLMFSTAGVLVDPSFPLVGLALVYAALVFLRFLRTDQDRRRIRRAFGYYVAPALLAQIERNGARLRLGGETRQLSVMFADMRGFTPLSERLEPQRLLAILNTLFGALGASVTAQLGTIDKFVGDAIMAFWNAPVDVADHARRACRAALDMRATLRRLNAEDAFGLHGAGAGVEEIGIGIGIATGEALVGNMGLETRFDYSALGDTVNTAARLEGACKQVAYDIVVAAATAAEAADFAMLEAGSMQLKGKSGRAPIHILVGDADLAASAAFRALQVEHGQLLAALRDGRDAGALVASCGLMAAAVEPQLLAFYRRLPERRDDFAGAQPLALAE